MGVGGRDLPALRLRARRAADGHLGRAASERLPPAAFARWGHPLRRGGRGEAPLPTHPRRDPAPTRGLLQPDACLLGRGDLSRPGAPPRRCRSGVVRRPRGRGPAGRLRPLPHPRPVGRLRSEVGRDPHRAPRDEPGSPPRPVALPDGHRPHGSRRGLEPRIRRPDPAQPGRAAGAGNDPGRRPVAPGRGRGGGPGRALVPRRRPCRDGGERRVHAGECRPVAAGGRRQRTRHLHDRCARRRLRHHRPRRRISRRLQLRPARRCRPRPRACRGRSRARRCALQDGPRPCGAPGSSEPEDVGRPVPITRR